MRFCVLASGSSGNAALLRVHGFGLLVDAGLGPRSLARRLALVGADWEDISAVLLTHVHGDHWNEATFAHLRKRGIRLLCHRSHATALKYESPAFAELLDGDQLSFYEVDDVFALDDGLTCRPLPLRHDGGVTCGFRFEGGPDSFGQSWALAYAADLGTWDVDLARALANVDVLALEFNHDREMQLSSGRAPALIKRVLGELGHLSNEQAADLVDQVLLHSTARPLRHLVQLHLSRQCNRPELARTAVQDRLGEQTRSFALHTASQHRPGSWLSLLQAPPKTRKKASHAELSQPWLPGLQP